MMDLAYILRVPGLVLVGYHIHLRSLHTEDTAQGSFTLALDALGLPLVQRLDEKSTAAMWADANINYA
jgi:hypothetical protein